MLGYYKEHDGPDARCVSYDKCFGGCPRHARFVPNMPFCAGTCDDPNGFQCEADNNELISDWENVKGELEIPGCLCRTGYIKATS